MIRSIITNNICEVAEAIRAKTGKTSPLKFPEDFISEIRNFPEITSFVERTISSFANDKITTIGRYAFYGCKQLSELIIPEVETIEMYAFNGCDALKSITLPKVKTVGARAFENCSSLETVDFSNIETINAACFSGCRNLHTLIIRTDYVPTLSNISALSGTPFEDEEGGIYVKGSLYETFVNETNWGDFEYALKIIEEHPEICGG